MKAQFTEKQQQAIDLREKNILVSAAAGSGKTAVLVERIIQLISEGEHPMDVDRLLVVTYTNAAAGEMRERIISAIGEKLAEKPEHEHLQRQSALIHNAQIATIHSFCLFVIRNHFQEIGLDPSFRVADEGEVNLLMQDVLSDVLEEAFGRLEKAEEGSPDKISGVSFKNLVEAYSTGKKETVLEKSILSIYRFAMSYPWPKEWLEEHGKDYEIHSPEELEQAPFIQYATAYLKNMLPELAGQLRECMQVCEEADGPYMYGENVEKSCEELEKAALAGSFFGLGDVLDRVSFDRLSSKKDDTVNPDKREYVKQVRNNVKKQLGRLKEQFFLLSGDAVLEQCKRVSPVIKELTDLVILFMERLSERKREKNLIDFSDMEHLALAILCKKAEGGTGICVEPTAAALELRDYFQEIMVDEYQDSNLVQECILSCISGEGAGHYNRFMVGDVKQSIYRFRLARPELFMEKFHRYSAEDGVCRRIDLSHNFRSRREVVDSVNLIFSQLFSGDLGGIDYDGASSLHYGAVYYDSTESRNTPELLLIENSGDEEKSAMEQEAEAIALRIKRLLRENEVLDKQSGKLRPARYGDIVILLRSANGIDEILEEALGKQDIPCFISSKTGYFRAPEVQTILQLLRILDNPLQDIPLFGVLKSCFGHFSDEELAMLSAAFPGRQKLFKKLKLYAEGMGEKAADAESFGKRLAEDVSLDRQGVMDGKLQEKCLSFLVWYERLRRSTVWLSVRELLEKIMEESHYLEYVAALPGGEKRRANAEMLLQKAALFEKTSFKGLYHFIRYIDQLEKYSVDYGEAGTAEESADVVRIMTIHKSKGLEFPICILAGTGRKMNRMDASAAVLTDMDMGLAVDLVDPILRTRQKTLRKAVLARKILLDSQAEELRVLYVALTRAKEKLIITGVLDDIEKELNVNLTILHRKETVLPYSIRSSADSYLELIIASAMRTKGMQDLLGQLHLQSDPAAVVLGDGFFCRMLTPEMTKDEWVGQERDDINQAEAFKRRLKEGTVDEELKERLQKRFGFCYPHGNLQKLYPKTTVSELKTAAVRKLTGQAEAGFLEESEDGAQNLFEEETIIPYLPTFLREEEKEERITGAAGGSAVHRVMELIDFRHRTEDLEKMIEGWREAGLLSEEYAKAVNRKKIVHFLESPLAERMEKAAIADRLSKEQPFMLGIGANRLSEEFPDTEQVLVQGIIDVYFEEDGEIVLLDYKTDVIKSPQEFINRYRVQMDYYAEALERITGKRVKERILYSFYLGREIKVDF